MPVSMANIPVDGSKLPADDTEKLFEGELPGSFETALARVETASRRRPQMLKALVSLISRALHPWGASRSEAGEAEMTHAERHVAFDGFHDSLYEGKTERDRRYGTVYEVSEERNAYLVRLEMPRRLPDSALKALWKLPDEMPAYDYSLKLADAVLAIRASVLGEAYRRLSYVSSSFPSEFLTRIAFAKPVGSFKHRLRDKVLEVIVFKLAAEESRRAA